MPIKKSYSLRVLMLVLTALVLVACATVPPPKTQVLPLTVVVLDLQDATVQNSGQAGIGELMASRIAGRFAGNPHYHLIDRQRMSRAIEQLQLDPNILAVDAELRRQFCEVLGAVQMVFGTYRLAGPTLLIEARKIDAASGAVLGYATAQAGRDDVAAWMSVAGQVANELMKN